MNHSEHHFHPSSTDQSSDSNNGQEEFVPFWKTGISFVIEVIKVVIVSLAIIIPVRYFLIQPFYVKGASMEPTLEDYQYLLIDEISYRVSGPNRGDIVVLKNPRNPREFFIKRVIGLPQERLIIQNGSITIYQQGKKEKITLQEPYLIEYSFTTGSVDVSLRENEYYVLGDNREASLDSRVFGPIDRKYIIGRTWIRAWPFGKMTRFIPPVYFQP